MIRVLLVDDQPLVRAGLRRILSGREGFEVVGECDDGAGGGAPLALAAGGNGLRGLRERAELLGAELHAGPDGEGWCVEVVVPTRAG